MSRKILRTRSNRHSGIYVIALTTGLAAIRVAVPKATVNEDHCIVTGKDDVGSAREVLSV